MKPLISYILQLPESHVCAKYPSQRRDMPHYYVMHLQLLNDRLLHPGFQSLRESHWVSRFHKYHCDSHAIEHQVLIGLDYIVQLFWILLIFLQASDPLEDGNKQVSVSFPRDGPYFSS
jgi:hypothetical protein